MFENFKTLTIGEYKLKSLKTIDGLVLWKSSDEQSYIRSGLIAMWDAIDNAGKNNHSATTRTWKDLIGNNDLTLHSTAYWTDDALCPPNYSNRNGYLAQITNASNLIASAKTIEVVCRHKNNESYEFIITTGTTSKIIYADNFGYPSGVGAVVAGKKFVVSDNCTYTATYDDTTNVYVNGDNGFNAGGNIDTVSGVGNNGVFCVGGRGNQDRPFNGDICCVRVYDRVLSEDEIKQNFEVDARRFGEEYQQELSYMISTGDQWIDTSLVTRWSDNFRIVLDGFITVNTEYERAFLGSKSTTPVMGRGTTLYVSGANPPALYTWSGSGTGGGEGLRISPDKMNHIEVQYNINNTRTLTVGDVTKQVTKTNWANGDEFKLALFTDGVVYNPSLKDGVAIGACKIYIDDVLVRDYIPVLSMDGKAEMYDKLSKSFATRHGSDFEYMPYEVVDYHIISDGWSLDTNIILQAASGTYKASNYVYEVDCIMLGEFRTGKSSHILSYNSSARDLGLIAYRYPSDNYLLLAQQSNTQLVNDKTDNNILHNIKVECGDNPDGAMVYLDGTIKAQNIFCYSGTSNFKFGLENANEQEVGIGRLHIKTSTQEIDWIPVVVDNQPAFWDNINKMLVDISSAGGNIWLKD